jgi:hypothetical protein
MYRTRTLRVAVLTGVAATAVLGGLGVATTGAEAATPTVIQVVEAAPAPDPGAAVTTADGRTVTVTGFPSTHYRAEAAHRQAVVQLAAQHTTTGGGGMTGNAPAGGVQQQAPQPGQAPQYAPNGQYQNASTAGNVGVGAVAFVAAILGWILVSAARAGRIKWGYFVGSIFLGVLLAGTFLGPLVSNLSNSSASAWSSFFGSL